MQSKTGSGRGSAGELALLAQVRDRVGRAAGGMHAGGVRLGIGDDCALLRLRPDEELAVTTDLSIAGRHFRLGWHPPQVVGHRTLARGLSDLAAMGARPVAAFLSLGLPPELVRNAKGRGKSWVSQFYDGLLALATHHRTPLAGGDLAESPVAVADIVLVGAVKRGQALLRAGARPGHLLYVTGSLGGAAAGLARLTELAAAASIKKQRTGHSFGLKIPPRLLPALEPHLYPQPRLSQGLWLAAPGRATAALDLSDGLSTDLNRLCAESRVAAEIDAAALPIAAGATLAQALNGGEDYELLFAARPDARIPQAIAGVPVTRIGRVVRRRAGKPAAVLIAENGSLPLEPRGWEHFSDQ